jgi:hypothetical protein
MFDLQSALSWSGKASQSGTHPGLMMRPTRLTSRAALKYPPAPRLPLPFTITSDIHKPTNTVSIQTQKPLQLSTPPQPSIKMTGRESYSSALLGISSFNTPSILTSSQVAKVARASARAALSVTERFCATTSRASPSLLFVVSLVVAV